MCACDPPGLGRSNPNFLVVGHRGAPNVSPENTIGSFNVAVALHANAIELDVCETLDGYFVVSHDCDPDSPIAVVRQGGGEGLAFIPMVPALGSPWRRPVWELTLAELHEHYGYQSKDGHPDPAPIPTLQEVLDWARTEKRLRAMYWDLKFSAGAVGRAVRFLHRLDDGYVGGALSHVRPTLLTVHDEVAAALEAERIAIGAKQLRVARDFEKPGSLDGTVGLGLRDISVGLTPSFSYSAYKREVAECVAARERREVDSVLVWTFDRHVQIAEMLYYSVDALITNDVGLAYRMWLETID